MIRTQTLSEAMSVVREPTNVFSSLTHSLFCGPGWLDRAGVGYVLSPRLDINLNNVDWWNSFSCEHTLLRRTKYCDIFQNFLSAICCQKHKVIFASNVHLRTLFLPCWLVETWLPKGKRYISVGDLTSLPFSTPLPRVFNSQTCSLWASINLSITVRGFLP